MTLQRLYNPEYISKFINNVPSQVSVSFSLQQHSLGSLVNLYLSGAPSPNFHLSSFWSAKPLTQLTSF